MEHYGAIAIIYNPKSTGASEANAKDLHHKLQAHFGNDAAIALTPTQHAGHAETLARDFAATHDNALIISSSGDGGYSEVVNGVMQASIDGRALATTGLLPSGNANDHYNSLTTGDIERLIIQHQERSIDLIKVTAQTGNKHWERYAHSYVGVGLTADASIEYNKISMNRVSELLASVKAIYNSQRSEIIVDGKRYFYDSLLFSNINRLGKLFSLSDVKADDGMFEIISLQCKHKAELLQQLARALTSPVDDLEHAATFSFTTTKRQAIQFDGEVFMLEPDAIVTVSSQHQALRCML